jgi:putative salt-induced outer membrane protein YdiY
VTRFCIVACLAVMLGDRPAAADEIQLSNGDRISGRVVSLINGLLVLQTPHGDLRVPWPMVTALVVVEPIFVTVAAAAPAAVTISRGGTSGRVELQPGGLVSVTEIVAMSRPPPPRVTIDGRLNAGIVASQGNTDANVLRFGGELVGRVVANRVTVGATFNRAREHDAETADNWTTSFRYDRFVTRRLFVNGNTIVSGDRLRDLTLRIAVGTGLGYQVVDRPRLRIATDGGIGFVKESSAMAPPERYIAAQESARADMFVDGNRVQFFVRQDGYFGLAGDDNRFVKTQNGVRVSVVGGVAVTAQLDVDYDPTPIVGGRSFDRTFALNFAYQF